MDRGCTERRAKAGDDPRARAWRDRRRPSGRRRTWPVLAGRTWPVLAAAMSVLAVSLAAAACSADAPGAAKGIASSTVVSQAAGEVGGPTDLAAGGPRSIDSTAITQPNTTGTEGTAIIPETPTNTGEAPTNTSGAPTTTTTLTDGAISDGIYLAGTDIDSGLYRGTVNGDKAHWEISSDANGNMFVAGNDPAGPFYIKIKYGQYLRLSGVTIEEADTDPADPLLTTGLTDGTYRVGYDIEAGWYAGNVDGGMGYWEISSDANGTSLVANDYPLGPFDLKVKDGQYLTLRGVTVSQ
jgi:hypothetical protein